MAESEGYSAGAYVSAAGSLAQLVAQIKAGSDAWRIAQYNADVAEVNAQAYANANEIEARQYLRQAAEARQDQLLIEQAQKYREARTREQHERILGTSRAIIASSGLMMSGSPLAVFEASARQQELDILAQRYQAAIAVRAAGDQATQAEYAAEVARYGAGERLRVGRLQSGLLRAQGEEAFTAGLLSATGTAVKGTTQAYSLVQRERLAQKGLVSPYDLDV